MKADEVTLEIEWGGEPDGTTRRIMLLEAVRAEGAFVLSKARGPYLIALVLPGETEVPNSDSTEVWSSIVAELEVALAKARMMSEATVALVNAPASGGTA